MAISRRTFLIGAGLVGGGLVLGVTLRGDKPPVPGTIAGSFQPNAWLQITADNRFVFQLHKVEMGQGVMTALPTLLAEELDVEPARLTIAMAGVHPDFVAETVGTQITGGSSSVYSSWDELRHAGAAARAMLVAAAATRWGVSPARCDTQDGVVLNRDSGERLDYGQLAEAAKAMGEVDYTLRDPADFRWIGQPLPRLDSVAKSTGAARFGIDVELPGMKTAVVVRCPWFGGQLSHWEPASVTGQPGVIAALVIHSGIAIVAEGYWPARRAAAQLQVEWDKGPLAGLDSAAILRQQQEALAAGDIDLTLEEGDVVTALAAADEVIDVQYTAPHTHHSPMEPQNATVLYTEAAGGNRCEMWVPNQAPDICRALAAHYGDVRHDHVEVHTTLLGGGFGRRGYPDYVGEAVAIARQLPGVPVKLVWSREDDMQHDFYRPSSLHRLRGAVDAEGRIRGWQHHLVSPSILQGFAVHLMSVVLPTWVPTQLARSMGKLVGDNLAGMDPTLTEGAKVAYAIDNIAVGNVLHDPGVPVGFWRSVGFSYNVFAAESFMDELAHLAGQDPLAFRLQHLGDEPRYRGVLEQAAAKAGWGSPAPGRSQGIAVAQPFRTYCAMVAEVSVNGDQFTLERVVAAVDCGRVVNPRIVKTQIESGIIYALSAAIKPPVTFADGRTEQSNFHDLPVIRIDEAPSMEVVIVDSEEAPTGVGEIGVPALAPALANALFVATGQRLRDLPLSLA